MARVFHVWQVQNEFGALQDRLFAASDADDARATAAEMAAMAREMSRHPLYAARLNLAENRLRRAIAAKAAADLRQSGAAVDSGRVAWDQLQRGDVLLANNKEFVNLYALYYSHSAVYDGNGLVYDSMSDGVRLRPLADWQQGQAVALGRAETKTPAERAAALDWAKAKYGTDGRTPFNYSVRDKQTDSRLYCAQLVWKIHRHLGLDVDSNDPRYQAFLRSKLGPVGTGLARDAVAPDEIFLSPLVAFYSVGEG